MTVLTGVAFLDDHRVVRPTPVLIWPLAMAETLQVEVGEAQRDSQASLRAWLACVTFYYPIFWLSFSTVWAGPNLVAAALFRVRLDYFRIHPFGLDAGIDSAELTSFQARIFASHAFEAFAPALIVLAITCLVLFIARRERMLSGLFIATLGNVALGFKFVPVLFFHQPSSAALVVVAVFYFALMCYGLRRMLRASPDSETAWVATSEGRGSAALLCGKAAPFRPARHRRTLKLEALTICRKAIGFPHRRAAKPLSQAPASSSRLEGRRGANEASYWRRLDGLLASFALPPLLLFLGFMLFVRFRFGPEILLFMAPGIVAAALASLRPARAPREPRFTGWRAVGLGVIASALLVVGAQRGAGTMERANQARIAKLLAAYPAPAPNLPYPRLFFQRGVNFTVEGPGGYASEEGRQMLASLPQYGINAVALVPYGFTRRGGSPTVGFGGWETDDMMRVGARIAHARGMKVMLKPAIWQAIDLDFPAADERREWFEQYGNYLEHYARLAAEIHADGFCIGGEFTHLTQYDAEWRKLIARVRKLYPGPLVYAANFGPEFESVKFWDALDYIGLQEYYPLPDNLDADAVVAQVQAVERRFNRPVIFTEAGFTSMEGANREPWDDSRPTPVAVEWQAKCYEAVFRAFYEKPWFEGVYWWKIGTNGAGGCQDGSFTPWRKPAMDVIKRWYLEGGR